LELARQSIVLLKNDKNLLPLKVDTKKIAVIGPAADDIYLQLGDYTPPVQPESSITLWEGLRQAVPSNVEMVRATGCGIRGGSQEEFDEAISLAKSSDIVILALGGSSSRFSGARFDINGAAIHADDVYMDCGEGVDSASLSLPGLQHGLAKAVFATGTPTVTIVTAGRPYAIPDIDSATDALLYAFYPGPWGGKALAEVLFGITNPSGRLPASLPRSPGQLPCYYNRKVFNANAQYSDMPSLPLYQFGYGLSYTSFTIDNFRVEAENESSVKVTFNICNSGNCAGFSVPMLYIRQMKGCTTPREKELIAFSKIWLERGRQEDVVLEFDKKSLSCRDEKNDPCTIGSESLMLILEEGSIEFWRCTSKQS
jgi:beta-glucosidase